MPNNEPPRAILAKAGALPEKMEAFILSDLPPPLQKHHVSPKTLIALFVELGFRVTDQYKISKRRNG